MPDYQLVRLFTFQITYLCRACVKSDNTEDVYVDELNKINELLAK